MLFLETVLPNLLLCRGTSLQLDAAEWAPVCRQQDAEAIAAMLQQDAEDIEGMLRAGDYDSLPQDWEHTLGVSGKGLQPLAAWLDDLDEQVWCCSESHWEVGCSCCVCMLRVCCACRMQQARCLRPTGCVCWACRARACSRCAWLDELDELVCDFKTPPNLVAS